MNMLIKPADICRVDIAVYLKLLECTFKLFLNYVNLFQLVNTTSRLFRAGVLL